MPSSFVLSAAIVFPPRCVRDDAPVSTSVRAGHPALPQGPSLRSGLFCPGPSSLIRPHPPHSRAQHDFTVLRLIRAAFAVRVRRGDPRAVPSFRVPFLLDMSSSTTPGDRRLHAPSFFPADAGLRPMTTDSATPSSHNPFHVGNHFGASLQFTFATTCRVACPLDGSDQGIHPSQQGRLLPGFRRFGHPRRRRI